VLACKLVRPGRPLADHYPPPWSSRPGGRPGHLHPLVAGAESPTDAHALVEDRAVSDAHRPPMTRPGEFRPYEVRLPQEVRSERPFIPKEVLMTLQGIADAEEARTSNKRRKRSRISTVFLRGGTRIQYRVDEAQRAVVVVGIEPGPRPAAVGSTTALTAAQGRGAKPN